MFTAALFTARTWTQPGHRVTLYIHWEMNGERGCGTYGILLRHRKECIRASVMRWLSWLYRVKSEREKQIPYINTLYTGNLEGWYYLQGSLGDTENSLMDQGWGKERGGQMERVAWRRTHHHAWNSRPVEFAVWLRELTPGLSDDPRGGEGGWREVREGEDTGMPRADSRQCAVETSTVL